MATSNLRIRAICNDQSIYSCSVSLGSFHGTKDTANCEGIMKLYPLNKSSKILHLHVAMRIFNVDRIHPTIFCHSIFAVNRNTQTDWCRMNEKVQIGVTMRHASIQVRNLIKRLFFSFPYISARKLSIIGENSNVISSDPFGRKINFSQKSAKYFDEAEKKMILRGLELANLNNSYPKWNVERLCNKPRITKNGSNKFRNQRNANIVSNPSNSYNAICRRQMLHKLDQLIAQKMIRLRKINQLKSANPNDTTKNSKRKIERPCRMFIIPSHQPPKKPVDMKFSTAGKNTADIPMLNDNWLLRESTNQNLALKSNGNIKNSSYFSSSKLTSSMATISGRISDSSVRSSVKKSKRNSMAEKWRNSGHTTISESDPETSSNIGSDISSDDNNDVDNGSSKSSTVCTFGSECSSEALTVTEFHSVK
uniref:Dentin sialophosphoprotein-like n=1 Tax=Elaeophora elaphi TaxID=1147741 RepID=A0A0R3RLU3_9BILA